MNPRLQGDLIANQALDTVNSLFASAYGVEGRSSVRGRTNWGTRFGWYSHERIATVYQRQTDPRKRRILAIRFGYLTRYGAIDLDTGSPFRTLEVFHRMQAAAEARSLRLSLCRSSGSGGWHVYLWSRTAVPSSGMHAVLRAIANDGGVTRFEDGSCEIYPDPQHPKQAFRLPGQAGFAWLSPADGSVVREIPPEGEPNILQMLDIWTADASVDAAVLCDAVLGSGGATAAAAAARKPRGRPPRIDNPPRVDLGLPSSVDLQLQAGLVYRYNRRAAEVGRPPFEAQAAARFEEGRRLFELGLQHPGTRNAAMRSVAFFLFFCGYASAVDRQVLLWDWLRLRHNGHSNDWVDPEGRLEVAREIRRMAAWRPDAPTIRSNERRRFENEERLRLAGERLRAAGKKWTLRALAAESVLSVSTVSRIWPVVERKIMG